jgi:transcriptional regulator with XRE-family HTH domain
MTKKNPLIGSSFDDFLSEEGILEEVEARARKRVLALQLEQMMKEQRLTKAQLARRMGTSRSALDRLLDPANASVTLHTMTAAAHALGTTLDISLARRSSRSPRERARHDPAVRRELLREAVETFVSGDLETGKAILRDYIDGTIGFEELGQATRKAPKSLMRMLSPRSNPDAGNLFAVLGYLQGKEGIHFDVRTER